MGKIGPEFITVGRGGKKIHNPAWLYSVDVAESKTPDQFDFKRMQHIYNGLRAVLARRGEKFTYVGTGRGGPGNKDSFVVVSPSLVWNKNYREYYGANLVWVAGHHFHAANFIDYSDAEQDALFAGDYNLFLELKRNRPKNPPSADLFTQNPDVEIERTMSQIRAENSAAKFIKSYFKGSWVQMDFRRFKKFARVEIQRFTVEDKKFMREVIKPLEKQGWKVEAHDIFVPNGRGAESWVRIKLYAN